MSFKFDAMICKAFIFIHLMFVISSCRLTKKEGQNHDLKMDPKPAQKMEDSRFNDQMRLPTDQEIATHIASKSYVYYFITEFDPKPLKDYLHQLGRQGSVQVVVGTERAFLTSVTKFLVLADFNPFVQLYNFINRGLLQLSQDHDSYLDLRFADSFQVWQNAMKKRGKDFGLNREVYFKFWNYAQTKNYFGDSKNGILNTNLFLNFGSGGLKAFFKQNKLEPLDGVMPRVHSYIEDPGFYQRLKGIADAGFIKIRQVDFTDLCQTQALLSALKRANLEVGIVDVSNIHHYLEDPKVQENYRRSLAQFSKSHVVVSELNSKFARITYQKKFFSPCFNYYVLDPGASMDTFFQSTLKGSSPSSKDLVIRVSRP